MRTHAYNFIPFADKLDRYRLEPGKAAGHERYDPNLHSGRFRCRLRTKTQLCFKAHFVELKKLNAQAYLPASSLKGAVRNAAEMLGAGCTMLFKDGANHPAVPGLEPCKQDGACLVCRLFGYSPEREKFGWQGKVRFLDSEKVTVKWEEILAGSARWQSHGTRHHPFYYPNGKPAGWKVYRHAQKVTGAQRDYTGNPPCVPEETDFTFWVEYLNLDDEELAVLRFALELRYQCAEHGFDVRLHHKMGYGKGIGLGSCEVNIDPAEPMNPYRYLDGAVTPREPARCLLEKYRAGMDAMRRFLDFNQAPERIEFPDRRRWFDDDRKKHLSIADFEADADAARETPGTTMRDLISRTEEKKATGPQSGDKIEVEILSVGKGRAQCRSLKQFDGLNYTGTITNAPGFLNVGRRCEVKVSEVKHETQSFKGVFQRVK